ncbi:MAG: hypothetical protein U9R72_09565 [Chloroflexota bacterium]|nr:hypothetical protein [Chloroflexota bacterium]
MDHLSGIGMGAVAAHDREIVSYAMERVSALPGRRIVGPPHWRGVCSPSRFAISILMTWPTSSVGRA